MFRQRYEKSKTAMKTLLLISRPKNIQQQNEQVPQFRTSHSNSPRIVAAQVLRHVHTIRADSNFRNATAQLCRR
jgi:hypothetical protein